MNDQPASADDLLDRCTRLLDRSVASLESRKKGLTAKEVDLVVRVARAAAEVIALQLDPLGAAGRKRLSKMTDAELAEARARLEGRS